MASILSTEPSLQSWPSLFLPQWARSCLGAAVPAHFRPFFLREAPYAGECLKPKVSGRTQDLQGQAHSACLRVGNIVCGISDALARLGPRAGMAGLLALLGLVNHRPSAAGEPCSGSSKRLRLEKLCHRRHAEEGVKELRAAGECGWLST